jgi:energy-coupling factor transporter transmembrane protein EcfT
VGRTSGNEQRNWISAAMMTQMNRAFKMSNDVYAAMLARGFTGRVQTYSAYRMTPADWAALAGAGGLALAALLVGRFIG